MSDSIKIIANNKKAYHDYFVEESFEAGIVLVGTEVKSLRMGKCSIKESFIGIDNGEIFVYGMNISPYEKGNIFKIIAEALTENGIEITGQKNEAELYFTQGGNRFTIKLTRHRPPKVT